MNEFMGLVRHVLTFGGGMLVANGGMTDVDMQSGVAAVMTIAGLVWSWKSKKQ